MGGDRVEKRQLLDALAKLPEVASLSQITDILLGFVANHGSQADYATLYRTQLTADHIAEYLDMKPEHELGDVVREIKQRYGV